MSCSEVGRYVSYVGTRWDALSRLRTEQLALFRSHAADGCCVMCDVAWRSRRLDVA